MKALVIAAFNDKYTNKPYEVGDVLDITEERFTEILKVAPLVEAIPEDTGDGDDAGDTMEQEAPVDEPEQETKTKKGRK